MNTSTRLLAAAAIVTLAGTLGGCSSKSATKTKTVAGPARSGAPMNQMVTDGRTVVRGQTVTVRLPTQAGSQYAWRLAPTSADNRFVSLKERKEAQSDSGKGETTPGSPAWDVFTFRANKTGQTSVDFIYDRPWDNGEPVRTYTLQLEVVKKGGTSSSAVPQHASVTVE